MSAFAGRAAKSTDSAKTVIANILTVFIVNSPFVMVFILVFIILVFIVFLPFRSGPKSSNHRRFCVD
jgi:hypothetical protein